MPTWLSKEYGPFTGTVWVVVIVGGVGLGLVMRRFLAPKGGDAASSEPAGTTTQPVYGVETGSPNFVGGGTLYNQGEIVSDVLEAINTQNPPPATTAPTVSVNRDWEAFVDYGEPGWSTAAKRFEDIFGYPPSKTANVAKINAEVRRARERQNA
jgi:hypothetical protein